MSNYLRMKTIDRQQALNVLSSLELLNYPEQKIKDILCCDYLDEEGNEKSYGHVYSPEVQSFLLKYISAIINYGVTNEYLTKTIEKTGVENIIVEGTYPVLEKCPCCDHRTLVERGRYDVCRVCFWEDDGTEMESENLHSYPNKMSLDAARNNFKEYGACDQRAKQFVDPEGPLKFAL